MRRKPKRASKYLPLVVVFLLVLCLIPTAYLVVPKGMPTGYKVSYHGTIIASAYNSLPGQTDASPWVTASGTRCREGVIASNHFPMGTKIMIEGFKGKVFVVEDRMNSRYKKRIDIWFRDYDDAIKFGVRKVKYYVLTSA